MKKKTQKNKAPFEKKKCLSQQLHSNRSNKNVEWAVLYFFLIFDRLLIILLSTGRELSQHTLALKL